MSQRAVSDLVRGQPRGGAQFHYLDAGDFEIALFLGERKRGGGRLAEAERRRAGGEKFSTFHNTSNYSGY
ncbi:MAG: hypothetical protein LC126_20310 [Bryobacterales bacterium]|nr:hypothetical protein [Bryobacterales bacterium]